MFTISLVIIFLFVCSIEFVKMHLSGKAWSENNGITIVFKFFISLISAYIMIWLIEFRWIPIPELSRFHFAITLLMTLLVNGTLTAWSCKERLLQALRSAGIDRYVAIGFFIVFAVFVLELTLFNFRHYESMGFAAHRVENYTLGDGLEMRADNSIVVKDEGDRTITIDPIRGYVNNLHLDFTGEPKKPFKITLQVRDEGSNKYYNLPSRELFQEIQSSQYLRLHLYGEARGIKISLDEQPGQVFGIREIGFNQMVPFVFSLRRCLFLQALLSMIYLLRPKSQLYQIRVNFQSQVQYGIILALIFVQVIFLWQVVKQNPAWTGPPNGHHAQYHQLVEAMVSGQVHLKEKPSEALTALTNPYDISEREEKQVYYSWDTAYYKDKYYVYFGVGPVLFFYLPYFLLLGKHLPTYIGIFIVCATTVCSVFGLTAIIVRRWFSRIPFITYLMVTQAFINGIGILYIVSRPDFYNFSIALGVLFSVLGLSMWMGSVQGGRLSKPMLALGSLSLALVATCRPQLLLGSFLAIPIFWNAVFKERLLFSKRSWANTVLFILPFVIVASGLMYYNVIRFDSIIDFGANYNLTTNDMTKRGFVLDRLLLGLYAYLVQPTTITNQFPFVHYKGIFTNYQGTTIAENPIGGVLFNNLFLVLPFMMGMCRSFFKNNREPYFLAILSTAFALIIIVADTQVAGILMRYLADFTWLLLIAATIVIFAISNKIRYRLHKRIWHGALLTSILASACIHYFVILAEIKYDLPLLANQVSYLIQFWL